MSNPFWFPEKLPKIEFPLPDTREKRFMFQVITSKMNLSKEIDLEFFIIKSVTIAHKLNNSVQRNA